MQLDKTSIADMDVFSKELWVLIKSSSSESFGLEIIDDGEVPLEFIVRLFVKVGFSCEDSVRLMMEAHKKGTVLLAKAEEDTLLALQSYIKTQAKTHGLCILTNIVKHKY